MLLQGEGLQPGAVAVPHDVFCFQCPASTSTIQCPFSAASGRRTHGGIHQAWLGPSETCPTQGASTGTMTKGSTTGFLKQSPTPRGIPMLLPAASPCSINGTQTMGLVPSSAHLSPPVPMAGHRAPEGYRRQLFPHAVFLQTIKPSSVAAAVSPEAQHGLVHPPAGCPHPLFPALNAMQQKLKIPKCHPPSCL